MVSNFGWAVVVKTSAPARHHIIRPQRPANAARPHHFKVTIWIWPQRARPIRIKDTDVLLQRPARAGAGEAKVWRRHWPAAGPSTAPSGRAVPHENTASWSTPSAITRIGVSIPLHSVPRRNPCLARDATRRNRWTHNRCEFSHLSLSAGMDQFSEDLRHGRRKMLRCFSHLTPHSSCSISSSIRLAHHTFLHPISDTFVVASSVQLPNHTGGTSIHEQTQGC